MRRAQTPTCPAELPPGQRRQQILSLLATSLIRLLEARENPSESAQTPLDCARPKSVSVPTS
jgi:hypothetical protein